MGTFVNQMAPVTVTLALAGYCCWSEADDRAAIPVKEKSARIELTPALLAPVSTPAPARNPFPAPAASKKLLTERSITKEPLVKMDLAKSTSHLVLRATFICGDRRLAMINGKFYGEGDSVTLDWREPEVNRSGPEKAGAAGPILPIKTERPIYHVAQVLADRVMLQCEDETTELQFLDSDRKSKSAASPRETNRGLGELRGKGGK